MAYRAFVSSTFDDLKAHRAHVINELRRSGIHVDPMEDWTATSEEPKQFSMERVKGCDLCVLLVGFRRGFIPDRETLSITQMEYKTAIEQRVEVLVFLGKEDEPWPPKFYELEKDLLLKQWRDELQKKHVAEFFDYTPQSIDVTPSIARWLQKKEPGAPAEAIAAIPEWDPAKLNALVERWKSEFAIQISAGHHDIASEGAARYVDLFVQNRESGAAQVAPRPLADLLSSPGSRSIVYGEGGSGKSTGLLKLAVDLAQRAVDEQKEPVPFYVRLNMFDSTQHGFERLLEIVGSAVGLETDDMRRLWLAGKRPLLFLLDGYNEVAPDCQQACAKSLQELSLVARHSILIASRPTVSLDFLLQHQFRAVDIVKFTDEQIRDFLDRAHVSGVYEDLTGALKELGRNPFMLWALAQSCVATKKSELPGNKGELYRNFVDRYIFEEREARKLPAPTVFNYKLVKKPVLSVLALEMCRAGVTNLPEDIRTLKRIRDELKRIRSEYEELVDVKPYVFMPESAKPNELLDELVMNGILRRTGEVVEFIHHSIRDYFAAVALLAETPESIIAEVPVASWVRHENFPFVANEGRSRLYDAIVMYSGFIPESDALIAGLQHKDPLLAAECLAAGTVSSQTTTDFSETCLAILRNENPETRLVGCMCVRASHIGTNEITAELERIMFSDEEWENTRKEAIRAFADMDLDTLVPTLLRLLGTTASGTLAFDATLAITRRIYGQPDYALAIGLLMWHFHGSDLPIEQREGLKWRQKMYSLYLAGHMPEELVDFVLEPSSAVSLMAALALLRLLHRPAAVKRFLEIIREGRPDYQLPILLVPQLEANEEVASLLRQMLEDRESRISLKINAARGLACIALQQDHPLSAYARIQISWNIRDFLQQRMLKPKLPVHDRAAVVMGLAKGAESFWLKSLLEHLRDPTANLALRVLVCIVDPEGLWSFRPDWVRVYELHEEGDRGQTFAAGLLERALEDENDYLRNTAADQIASASQELQAWALPKVLQQLNDRTVSLKSRKAAVHLLARFSTNEARARLRELIRDAGEPPELIAQAIQSFVSSPDCESALKEIDALVTEAPDNAVFRSGRSLCLMTLNRIDEALEDALRAVELSPNDAQLHIRLGNLHGQNEEIEEAVSSYRRAVELDEHSAEAHWRLAIIASSLKNTEEALVLARRAAQLETPMPEQLVYLGWFAYENGNFQESIDASKRAAQLDPVEAMSLFNLGLALIATGDTVEASEVYEAGIDRCFAFSANSQSISGALEDLDKLQGSRPELRSTTDDIQRRLRECEKRLKELAG